MTVRGQHRYLVTLRHPHMPQGVGQMVHARFQLMIGIAPRAIDYGGLRREQTGGTARSLEKFSKPVRRPTLRNSGWTYWGRGKASRSVVFFLSPALSKTKMTPPHSDKNRPILMRRFPRAGSAKNTRPRSMPRSTAK